MCNILHVEWGLLMYPAATYHITPVSMNIEGGASSVYRKKTISDDKDQPYHLQFHIIII